MLPDKSDVPGQCPAAPHWDFRPIYQPPEETYSFMLENHFAAAVLQKVVEAIGEPKRARLCLHASSSSLSWQCSTALPGTITRGKSARIHGALSPSKSRGGI
jgi:hypothetical protein